MFKFVIIGLILVLATLLLAEPIMQVGHRISNRIKKVSDSLDEDGNEDESSDV